MTATLITEFKDVADDGSIIQMIVWRVPEAVPPTVHGFKYRLVYVVEGVRVVGFDNEEVISAHMHPALTTVGLSSVRSRRDGRAYPVASLRSRQ